MRDRARAFAFPLYASKHATTRAALGAIATAVESVNDVGRKTLEHHHHHRRKSYSGLRRVTDDGVDISIFI